LRRACLRAALVLPLIASVEQSHAQPSWRFNDVTEQAGVASSHGYRDLQSVEQTQIGAGGVAAGDFDGDGYVDLYVVVGEGGTDRLFRNQRDGTFVDRASQAGVVRAGGSSTGPLFFDYDGDGRLDLLVGGVRTTPVALFHNVGDGTFSDVTAASGLAGLGNTSSATAADYDGDGWVDLFLGRWGSITGACHLWRNLGGHFQCVDHEVGLDLGLADGLMDQTYTANFVDLDGDGALDLLMASDSGQSTVWMQRQRRFINVTNRDQTKEDGMGAAVGDYDGDGQMDWFVSAISGRVGAPGLTMEGTGNRLYRGLGGGAFEDVTDAAGVREGGWGWGASFSDFNNDGWLDLVHVSGWYHAGINQYDVPARLFLGGPTGRFHESAEGLGLNDRINGRGVVCFDYDQDGDVDIFVAHNNAPHKLWRNDGGNAGHYLDVSVVGMAPNLFAVGATVEVTAAGRTQIRTVRDGSNYVSQDPFEAHFGLGDLTSVDRVKVRWPDGKELMLHNVGVDRRLEVKPGGPVVSPSTGCAH
jgi:hypothetical protein